MSSHPDQQAPVAGLASIVCDLITGPSASGDHPSSEDRAEIAAITQAMLRLLLGAPLRSDGKLTVKSLAEEAGLKRNKLTHKHPGLKDVFYALVKAQHSAAPDRGRPAARERPATPECAGAPPASRRTTRDRPTVRPRRARPGGENQQLRDHASAASPVTVLRQR
jgi:hypothetical protein